MTGNIITNVRHVFWYTIYSKNTQVTLPLPVYLGGVECGL